MYSLSETRACILVFTRSESDPGGARFAPHASLATVSTHSRWLPRRCTFSCLGEEGERSGVGPSILKTHRAGACRFRTSTQPTVACVRR